MNAQLALAYYTYFVRIGDQAQAAQYLKLIGN